MNTTRTVQLKTVYKDEDGNVQGGRNFYWTIGAHIVIIQEWEHRASGPVWTQVIPDPMSGTDLVSYFLDAWKSDEDGRVYEVQDAKIYT